MYVDSKVLREEDTGNFVRKSLHIHRLRVKVVMNNGNFFRKSLHIHRLRVKVVPKEGVLVDSISSCRVKEDHDPRTRRLRVKEGQREQWSMMVSMVDTAYCMKEENRRLRVEVVPKEDTASRMKVEWNPRTHRLRVEVVPKAEVSKVSMGDTASRMREG